MSLKYSDGKVYFILGADFQEALFHLNSELKHSDDSFWARYENCELIKQDS
jgi:hypothetical protein